MANAKKIISDYSATGSTVYAVIRREADEYLLNDADGAFAAAPADPYISLTENATIKGRYEKSEARAAWNDGQYTVAVYLQSGGSPSPVADTIIGSGSMYIVSDTEVVLDAAVSTRLASASYTAAPSAPDIRAEIDANSVKLDVAVSSRLATAGYTAPDNATITAIAGYTDSIESRIPAALVGGKMDSVQPAVPTASENADAVWAKTLP